ncbi:MAG: hypothetical protein CMO80_05005 [Verrucomicrobiales bacterium]|nr:hypothetical protein [Verrucomicrobiales bacterium]|tara:strand:- start:2594 stop:3532 length:939 start_codon:yes stop_codon:yes gene_type:complete
MPKLLILLLATLCTLGLPAADSKTKSTNPKSAGDTLQERILESQKAFNRREYRKALDIINSEFAKLGENAEVYMFRGTLHAAIASEAGASEAAMMFYDKAVQDFSKVIKLSPHAAAPKQSRGYAYQERGSAYFRSGKIEESIKDWDKFISFHPRQEPYHWQRGIAHYYAGQYEKGRQQFELHQTVNSADVENAVFHFICTAKSLGLERAKKDFIPIKGDRRVPMMEIHGLFAGSTKVEDVIAAAEKGEGLRLNYQLFYAHYYIALYFESHGDDEKARNHVMKAAAYAPLSNYMGDCARVHKMLLLRRDKAKK